MRITVPAGGVGGARFLRGLLAHLDQRPGDGTPHEVTVIGNTGDDITLYGLRVSPDLDTVLYTLGGAVEESQGWGRAGDTGVVREELAALGAEPQWFSLGDRDIATHIARSQWLGQGLTLSQVTHRLADRWGLTDRGVRLLPVTDHPIETHVVLAAGDGEKAVHFQEWWVRRQAQDPALRFVVAGLDRATPAPGVLDAVRSADVVLLPPSNPVVSLGIILAVPGVRDALRGTRAPVVGVSPIVGGKPVRGHADACLKPLGVEVSSSGVLGMYQDLLDGWLVDPGDEARSRRVGPVRVRRHPLLMTDEAAAASLAGAALDLAVEIGTTSGREQRS